MKAPDNADYYEQRIKDLKVDVADCEKSVRQAEQEVKDAQEWLMKQKLHLAEAIIRLHNETL
jgi:hypothetical protein